MSESSSSTAPRKAPEQAAPDPRAHVVILTWNGEKWIEPCLESIFDDPDFPAGTAVTVIDNASTDRTADIVQTRFPRADLVRNDRNTGFAAGMNQGMRLALHAGADNIVLLNQDLRVERGWLRRLLEAAERDPACGLLSPMLYDYSGADLDPNFRKQYDPSGRHRANGIVYVERLAGAAVLVRRRLIERIGLFDPAYFCYGADCDYHQRCRYRGFKIGVVRDSKVCHWHSLVQDNGRRASPAPGRIKNTLAVELKNPTYPFLGHLYRFVRYRILRRAHVAFRKRRWAELYGLLGGALLLVPHVPRHLLVRRAERRGPCHM